MVDANDSRSFELMLISVRVRFWVPNFIKIKFNVARKRRKKETSFARRQRRENQKNNNSPNLAGFSDLPEKEEKPEIFCKECNE